MPLPDAGASAATPPDQPGPGTSGQSPGGDPGGAQLLQLVLGTAGVEDHLDELARLTQALDPAITGCGITLQRDGHLLSVASSNAYAGAVDEIQYGLDVGPCLQAMRTGEVVEAPDLDAERRWDGYPAHALAHGVHAVLSVPMSVAGRTVATSNCYSDRAHTFADALHERVLGFTAQAEVALTLTMRRAEQDDVLGQLQTAMRSRSVIDQALGIVMSRQRCTAEDAFAVLRTASQARNRRIADIAADLITSSTGQPPTLGRFER